MSAQDELAGVIPDVLTWDKVSRQVYEHGAVEPETPDYWVAAVDAGVPLAALLVQDFIDLAPIAADAHKELGYLRDRDGRGEAVMIEYRENVELHARLVGWRGYQLFRDQQEIARASRVISARIEE